MSDTPIIDAALSAYWASRQRLTKDVIADILRAANPWEPPREKLRAMAEAFVGKHRWFTFNGGEEEREIAAMRLAIRAAPIMRELYDSDGAPR